MGVCFEKKHNKYINTITGEEKEKLTNSEMIMDMIATQSRIDYFLLDALLEKIKTGEDYWCSNKTKKKINHLRENLSGMPEFENRFDGYEFTSFIAEVQKIYKLDYTGKIRLVIAGNLRFSFCDKLKLFRFAPEDNFVKTNPDFYYDMKTMSHIRNVISHSDVAMQINHDEARMQEIEEIGIEYFEKYLGLEDLYENYNFLADKWKLFFSSGRCYLSGGVNE